MLRFLLTDAAHLTGAGFFFLLGFAVVYAVDTVITERRKRDRVTVDRKRL